MSYNSDSDRISGSSFIMAATASDMDIIHQFPTFHVVSWISPDLHQIHIHHSPFPIPINDCSPLPVVPVPDDPSHAFPHLHSCSLHPTSSDSMPHSLDESHICFHHFKLPKTPILILQNPFLWLVLDQNCNTSFSSFEYNKSP